MRDAELPAPANLRDALPVVDARSMLESFVRSIAADAARTELLAIGGFIPVERNDARIPVRANSDTPAPDAREVMSTVEVAAFLGVDRDTVYDAAARGEIPHRRIGKRLLFSRSQLVSWLGACKAAQGRNG